jgi:hypothetical protein
MILPFNSSADFGPVRPRLVPLLIGESKRAVCAGAYEYKPHDHFGVRLTVSGLAPTDLHLPIPDFGVPKESRDVYAALAAVLNRLACGLPVYVGCGFGRGRTGLFLALLAKATGASSPVSYVRRFYHPGAVETSRQAEYVSSFDTSPLNPVIRKAERTASGVDFARRTKILSFAAPLAGRLLSICPNMV